MCWLILGLVLWSCIHLFPSVAMGARGEIISKLGLWPFKGIFAILIASSITLIVFWLAQHRTHRYLSSAKLGQLCYVSPGFTDIYFIYCCTQKNKHKKNSAASSTYRTSVLEHWSFTGQW